MYLSLLRLNPLSYTVQRDIQDVTQIHRTIMNAFPSIILPDETPRSFYKVLFRLEHQLYKGNITLYVQSTSEPDWSHLPKDYLENSYPAVKSIKESYENLKVGQALRFRLRANPTRKVNTKSEDGNRRNGRRVPISSPENQIEWLVRKSSDHGFHLLNLVIASTGSSELVRSHVKPRTFQGVLFEGVISINNLDIFLETLKTGIGPGKAFGFGMLSIGPH